MPVAAEATRALPGRDGLVVLDIAVDDELAAEGTARDVVREVQQRRRDLGLDVTDRITLELRLPPGVRRAIEGRWAEWIAGQTLATSYQLITDDTLTDDTLTDDTLLMTRSNDDTLTEVATTQHHDATHTDDVEAPEAGPIEPRATPGGRSGPSSPTGRPSSSS